VVVRRALVSLVAVAAALLCAAPSARAQQASEHPSDNDRVLDEAVAEFGQAHFVEARALFERAHTLDPTARTLRGIGMTEFELRHYTRALQLLRQALVDGRKPLTDELRAKTEELVQRTETFVARYRPSLEPASARLEIDGAEAMMQDDGTLWLDAGEHTLRVSAKGFATHEQKLDARGGTEQALVIALAPAAVPTAAPAVDAHEAAQPASVPAPTVGRGEAPAANAGPGAWPWVVIAASAALLVGGGALVVLSQIHAAKVEDAKKGTDFADVRSANDAVPVESTAGFAMLGVGGAGLITGLVWKLSSSSEQAEVQAIGASMGLGSVQLTGRF